MDHKWRSGTTEEVISLSRFPLSICELAKRFGPNPYHENLLKASDYICIAPIVYHSNAFYVFGGQIDYDESNIIGRFDKSTLGWTKAGELNSAREGHGGIFNGDVFIIAGGDAKYQTEACSIENGEIFCMAQAPVLDRYYVYPEMYLVDDVFCKDI